MLSNFQRFPLAIIFTSYAMGIILSSLFHIPLLYWVALLLFALITELTVFNKKSYPIFLILFFLLGGMNYGVTNTYPQNHISSIAAVNRPIKCRAKITKTENLQQSSAQIILNDIQILLDKWLPFDGKMLLYIEKCDREYVYGDQIEFSAKISRPALPDNPGEFNYRRYLELKNIYATTWIETGDKIEIYDQASLSIPRYANLVKIKIIDLIDKSTDSRTAPILKALITGARGEISDQTEQLFIDSGVIHILAVSGLHVGYVTLVFLLIFGFLRFPLKTKYLLTILALWFYAAMVQFKPSVVRAVTMASCILLGKIMERPYNIYNALGFAALLQTFIMPKQLFNVGFQLSFVAVFSIVYIYNRINSLLPENFKPGQISNKSMRYVYQLFLVSLAAQLGTLPLTIYYFNRVPVISIVANIFAIPLVGLIGALGFAQVILGFIWKGISIAYGEVQNLLVFLLRNIIKFFANFPFSFFDISQISIIHIIIIYSTLYITLNLDKQKYRKYFLIFILSISNLWIWQKALTRPDMELIFFDVGQGDAALISLPDNKNILVDCGARGFHRDYGREVIAPYLKKAGIRKIDILAISHPHNDHIGGVPYILQNFEVDRIWETNIASKSRVYKEVNHIADSLNIPIYNPHAGDVFCYGKNAIIRILHPSKKFLLKTSPNFNNASTTFKLSYNNIDILFTGDVEKEAERYLALYENDLKSEILKVPHHGSSTSSTPDLIKYTAPRYALISVGNKNKFGHPSQKTIKRYQDWGTIIHRTDQAGALVVRTKGKKPNIVNWY